MVKVVCSDSYKDDDLEKFITGDYIAQIYYYSLLLILQLVKKGVKVA